MSRTVLGILGAAGQPEKPCTLKHACEKARVPFRCESGDSVHEAARYLNGAGPYGNRHRYPMPTLVILDLDLEGSEGYQALSWIRGQRRLRNLPVVVLSRRKSQMDMKRAYDLGANSYLTTPESSAELVELVRVIERYWLTLNHTPRA
jgi:DNA-binding response OmpR family regulator